MCGSEEVRRKELDNDLDENFDWDDGKIVFVFIGDYLAIGGIHVDSDKLLDILVKRVVYLYVIERR